MVPPGDCGVGARGRLYLGDNQLAPQHRSGNEVLFNLSRICNTWALHDAVFVSICERCLGGKGQQNGRPAPDPKVSVVIASLEIDRNGVRRALA